MLPRALILLLAIGITAVAAANLADNYNQDRNRDDRYRNNPGGYSPSNTQDYNSQYGQGYGNQGYDPNRNQNYGANNNYQNNNYQNNNNNNNNNYPNNQYGDNNNNRNYNNVYAKNQTAIFCYINGTRISRPSYSADASLGSDDIDITSCTHLMVGAVTINPSTFTLSLQNNEFTREGSKLSFGALTDYKRQNPNLKVFVSISGDPHVFANMVKFHSEPCSNSIATFLAKYQGIGVNIDWRWPALRSSESSDEVRSYFNFLKNLKGRIRSVSSSPHELSIFLPPEDQQMRDFLDEARRNEVLEYIDYYILMGLELRGHSNQKIEHHAPYYNAYNSGMQSVSGAIESVKSYAGKDLLYKIILAIPFYGKRYHLEGRSLNNNRSPMGEIFTKQRSIYQDSFIATYAQVCRELSTRQYNLGYDEQNQCAWAVHDSSVYVYEDATSVRRKTLAAIQAGFGGVMAYSIEMDDTTGQCANAKRSSNDRNYNSYANSYSDYNNKFPLLRAMKEQVDRGNGVLYRSSPLAVALAVICAFILKFNN